MTMLQRVFGQHYLAAQWGMWSFDALAGRLPGLGFQRWATTAGGQTHKCKGEAWGTHWQWGDLRLAPWGCWLKDDDQAWAYLPQQDRFFSLDFWTLDSDIVALQEEITPEEGLRHFEFAALASELEWSRFSGEIFRL